MKSCTCGNKANFHFKDPNPLIICINCILQHLQDSQTLNKLINRAHEDALQEDERFNQRVIIKNSRPKFEWPDFDIDDPNRKYRY